MSVPLSTATERQSAWRPRRRQGRVNRTNSPTRQIRLGQRFVVWYPSLFQYAKFTENVLCSLFHYAKFTEHILYSISFSSMPSSLNMSYAAIFTMPSSLNMSSAAIFTMPSSLNMSSAATFQYAKLTVQVHSSLDCENKLVSLSCTSLSQSFRMP